MRYDKKKRSIYTYIRDGDLGGTNSGIYVYIYVKGNAGLVDTNIGF